MQRKPPMSPALDALSAPSPALSHAQVEHITQQFLKQYNGNVSLKVVVVSAENPNQGIPHVRPDPQSFAGEHRNAQNGSYSPAHHTVIINADTHASAAAVARTLRHEILGHYGLDTFKPNDKNALIDRISQTQDTPSLRHIWSFVKRNYADQPLHIQAEEVFAFVAEDVQQFAQTGWSRVRGGFKAALRKAGLTDGPLELDELRQIAFSVSEGIRTGARTLETFNFMCSHYAESGDFKQTLNPHITIAATQAVVGMLEQQRLAQGRADPVSTERINSTSMLLVPRYFRDKHIGWDCQKIEPGMAVPHGARRVYGNGYVQMPHTTHSGKTVWEYDPDLSVDAHSSRLLFNQHLSQLDGVATRLDGAITLEGARQMAGLGWSFKQGSKAHTHAQAGAYIDASTCSLEIADNETLDVTIYTKEGRRVPVVAWLDRTEHARLQVERHLSANDERGREIIRSLLAYTMAGCPSDTAGAKKELALGAELFNELLNQEQRTRLRTEGVYALDSVIMQIAEPEPSPSASHEPSM